MPTMYSLLQHCVRLLTPALLTGALACAAHAQTQTQTQTNIMVPYPAGGVSDIIARAVATPLAKVLEQTVLVENLGGAGGTVGAQKVLNAPANGQYVFMGTPTELILAPQVNAAVKFDAEDFQLLQLNTYAPIVMVARKELPANTIDELITLIRQSPKDKPLSYGSVGPGSMYHVQMENFSHLIGAAPMTHVPYKGMMPVLQDMAGNNVDIAFMPHFSAIDGMVASGRIKIIGQASSPRATTLPAIPSLTEGKLLKNFNFIIWGGYFVKKGTPQPIVDKLHKALQTSMADTKLRENLEGQSMILGKAMSLDESAKFYASETAVYRKLVKAVGVPRQ